MSARKLKPIIDINRDQFGDYTQYKCPLCKRTIRGYKSDYKCDRCDIIYDWNDQHIKFEDVCNSIW